MFKRAEAIYPDLSEIGFGLGLSTEIAWASLLDAICEVGAEVQSCRLYLTTQWLLIPSTIAFGKAGALMRSFVHARNSTSETSIR